MAVMIRFEDVLAAHRDRPIYMPELCIAIDVSERTLRTCCAEFLVMSPGRYLRLLQLKLARTALQTADATTTSVAAIARLYGFAELLPVAEPLYRTAYGETPSTTSQVRRRASSRE